jgi:hypothetical protein
MDSVDAANNICKFSDQLKIQQQQIEDLEKEFATIEGSFLNHSSFFAFFLLFFPLFFSSFFFSFFILSNEHPPPPFFFY